MAKKSKDEKKSKKRKLEEIQPEQQEKEKETEKEKDEEEKVEEVMEIIESPEPEQETEIESESETERPQPQKSEARPRHDPFREYYMTMLTEEFGDDLDTLRKDKSFNEKRSLPILIHALEQGINIFTVDEQQAIIDQRASEKSNN